MTYRLNKIRTEQSYMPDGDGEDGAEKPGTSGGDGTIG